MINSIDVTETPADLFDIRRIRIEADRNPGAVSIDPVLRIGDRAVIAQFLDEYWLAAPFRAARNRACGELAPDDPFHRRRRRLRDGRGAGCGASRRDVRLLLLRRRIDRVHPAFQCTRPTCDGPKVDPVNLLPGELPPPDVRQLCVCDEPGYHRACARWPVSSKACVAQVPHREYMMVSADRRTALLGREEDMGKTAPSAISPWSEIRLKPRRRETILSYWSTPRAR